MLALMKEQRFLKLSAFSKFFSNIDVETTKVVLILTATYKKPKDASEVAKNMAEAFKLYSESESETKTQGGTSVTLNY